MALHSEAEEAVTHAHHTRVTESRILGCVAVLLFHTFQLSVAFIPPCVALRPAVLIRRTYRLMQVRESSDRSGACGTAYDA